MEEEEDSEEEDETARVRSGVNPESSSLEPSATGANKAPCSRLYVVSTRRVIGRFVGRRV